MAAYHGRTGEILAPAGLGEITAWTYAENAEETEAPAMGLTAKRTIPGLIDAGGSFTLNYDDGDTEAEALAVGSTVALILHPRGTLAGYPSHTSVGNDAAGVVAITAMEMSGDVGSIVTRTYTFKNNLLPVAQV